jgi:hypothetical protein
MSTMSVEKLTTRKLARCLKPGKYGDGGGLYLQVTNRLVRSWIFRYARKGKEHFMGLGPLHAVDLAQAREAARAARALLAQGLDPIQARAASLGQ